MMSSPSKPTPQRRSTVLRIAGVITVAAILIALYFKFGDAFSLQNLAARETDIRQFHSDHPVLIYLAAFAIYVTVTGLSMPGAAVLTLAYGWYFGFWKGLPLVSFASTAGATVAFLMSRYLIGNFVQAKFGDRLEAFNRRLDEDGPFYLFTLRLIFGVPFLVVNVVMGLTRIKVLTFWWVSQLGMLAGTCVYVWAGSTLPGLQDLADDRVSAVFNGKQLIQLALAFGALGLFPLIAKKLISRFAKTTA